MALRRDQRALEIQQYQLDQIRKDIDDEYRIVEGATFERLGVSLKGREVSGGPELKSGQRLTQDYLDKLAREDWFKLRMKNDSLNRQLERAQEQLEERRAETRRAL